MNKMVSIVWNDAQSIDAWTGIDDICGSLAEIHTLGFLIKKTRWSLTVALNHDISNDAYSCMIIIPKKWIKEIKEL